MLTFYQKYAFVIEFSQQGEEGIINEIFHRLGYAPKNVCEFGAHDGLYCSNTRNLLLEGAKGTLIEADENLYLQCKENSEEVNADVFFSMVTPENVNELIPTDLDLLSIDTDGPDYHIWKAYKGKPPVVIIEINSSYLPMEDRIEEGANYSAMLKLGIEKGYFLLCHTGNMIFVDTKYRDKFPEIIGDGLINYSEYFNRMWL